MSIAFLGLRWKSEHTVRCGIGVLLFVAGGSLGLVHSLESTQDIQQETGLIRCRMPGVFTLVLPPTVEIQGGMHADMKKTVEGDFEFPGVESRVVIQQSGLNNLSPPALQTYFRVIVETSPDSSNSGLCLSDLDLASLAQSDPASLNLALKEQLLTESSQWSQDLKLIEWKAGSVTAVNGMYALTSEYVRQMKSNPQVRVCRHVFVNKDLVHKVQIEFRLAEWARWEPEAQKILADLQFDDRCSKSSTATAHHDKKGFSVEVPCELTADSSGELITWSCTSLRDGALFRFNKQRIGEVRNQDFLEAYEDNLASAGISDRKYIRIDNTTALYYSLETSVAGSSTKVRSESGIFSKGGTSYTIVVTTSSVSSKTESSLFKTIAAGFRVRR